MKNLSWSEGCLTARMSLQWSPDHVVLVRCGVLGALFPFASCLFVVSCLCGCRFMLVESSLTWCLLHELFVVIEVLRSLSFVFYAFMVVFWMWGILLYFDFPSFRLSSVPVARCSLASVLRYQSRAPTWQVFCRSWAARMAEAFDSWDTCIWCLGWFVVCRCNRFSMSLRSFSQLVWLESLQCFPLIARLAVISRHSGVGCGSVLMLRHCVVGAFAFVVVDFWK